jgi:hypothetical protein
MVRRTPGLTWLSVGLALPAIVMLVLQALFYFYAAGSLAACMMGDTHARNNRRAVRGRRHRHAAGLGLCLQLRAALQHGHR